MMHHQDIWVRNSQQEGIKKTNSESNKERPGAAA